MQRVTPSTTTGTELLLGLDRDLGLLFLELPRDRVGQHFLHGHPRGLAALRVHARLGAVLQLLGALRGDGDEPELAVPFAGQDPMRHRSSTPYLRGNVPRISRATGSTRLVRSRAACTMVTRSTTVRSRSSLTRQGSDSLGSEDSSEAARSRRGSEPSPPSRRRRRSSSAAYDGGRM